MFGQTFYHKTIRKYIILFGTLFNEVYINRADNTGANIQTLKVPITYGPKSKGLARVDSDPLLSRPYQVVSPLMSFEMTSMTYAADRKLSTIRKHNIKGNALNVEQQKYIYNPVPYDMEFNLYVMTKNAEDGTKILEQILPYFTPEWTTTVNIVPELDVKLDIPVIIKGVTTQDSYEGGVEEKRTIIHTINFTLKGYLFGPVRKSEIIKLATVDFFSDITATPTYDEVVIQPGMLANGSPTSNASLTVDYTTINEDDDWTYIVTKSEVNE